MRRQIGMQDIAARYVNGLVSKADFLAFRLSEVNLTEQCRGIAGCNAFVRGMLRDGFWALDKLDRDDAFWEGTNRLPTLNKLPRYAEYQIRSGTNLVDAAWLSIVCELARWRQHLEIGPWKILLEHGSLDLRFLVRTARNSGAYWGDESVVAFAELVRELDLDAAVGAELDSLAASDAESREWVEKVFIRLYPA